LTASFALAAKPSQSSPSRAAAAISRQVRRICSRFTNGSVGRATSPGNPRDLGCSAPEPRASGMGGAVLVAHHRGTEPRATTRW
jgi:hypothetical protein